MINGDMRVETETQRIDPYEDEIELMDYLKVLWKWKYLILVGTLLCAVGAAVISLNMTKVYSITTVLSPGVAKVEANGQNTYISSLQNIKTLVETGALESSVLTRVKVPNKEDLPESLNFKVTTPKGSTNTLEISYETPDVDLGVQVLNGLNESLLGKFDELVRYFKEGYNIQILSKSSEGSRTTEKMEKAANSISITEAENMARVSEIEAQISSKNSEMAGNEAEKESKFSEIDNKISSKNSEMAANEAEKNAAMDQRSNNILTIQAQVEAKKKQIKNLKDRISDLKTEIERISKNTDMLLKDRDKFLSSTKNENNILASVMYTTTIQQNLGYLNSLRSNVNQVNHQIFQENAGIEKLENSINDIGVQKLNLEKQTKISYGRLIADIEDIQAQKTNLEKQTKNQQRKTALRHKRSSISKYEPERADKGQNRNTEIRDQGLGG